MNETELLKHNLRVNALELYIYNDLFVVKDLITNFLKTKWNFELPRIDFNEMWDGNPITIKGKLNSEHVDTMFTIFQGLSTWGEQVRFDSNHNCWKIDRMCQILKIPELDQIVNNFYHYKNYVDHCDLTELKKINLLKDH